MHEAEGGVERERRVWPWALWLLAPPALWSALSPWLSGDLASSRLGRAWVGGALVPDLLAVQPWRLLTASLLHVDGLHLAMNLLLLGLLVRPAVRGVGGGRAMLIYGVGGLLGVGGSALITRGWSLGASAGGFALLGALIAARRRAETPDTWAGVALLAGAAMLVGALGPSDHAAHLTGLGAGAALEVLLRGRRVGWALAALTAAWVAAMGLAVVSSRPGAAPWVERPAFGPCVGGARTDGLVFVCTRAQIDRAELTARVGLPRVSPLVGAPGWRARAPDPEDRRILEVRPTATGYRVTYCPDVRALEAPRYADVRASGPPS